MIDKTEKEIIENWKLSEQPTASICCITYNHEQYIEEAIDSFLKQETDFKFEILIHDDFSNDNTRNIIIEYAKKYPNIIRTIFQTENQWSLGKRIMPIVLKEARGKFMALCEGDDYWIASNKLQIQIDEMEKHKECHISFHAAYLRYDDNSNKQKLFCYHSPVNKIFNTDEIIQYGGPLMPTASICLKRNFVDFLKTSTEDFFVYSISAFFIQVFSSLNGGALYINKIMSVYRSMSTGSWSKKVAKNSDYSLFWAQKSINSIGYVDNYTNKKYSKEFKRLKKKHYFTILLNDSLSVSDKDDYFVKFKKDLNYKDYLKWHLIYRNKKLHKLLVKIKKKLLNFV